MSNDKSERVPDFVAPDEGESTPVDTSETISTFDEIVSKLEEDAETVPEVDDGVASSYLDDDEEFLTGDDETLSEELSSGLVQQEGAVVGWSVENFYRPNGKPRGRLSLRQDPPVLSVKDSTGAEVTFLLSKDFSRQLASVMEDVHRGYFGVSSKRTKGLDGSEPEGLVGRILHWVVSNKLTATLAASLLFCVLVIVNLV